MFQPKMGQCNRDVLEANYPYLDLRWVKLIEERYLR